MAIITDLLIAAPMLQDLLVDTNGIPLSGGFVTLYEDQARTILKNWYEQVNSGNSSYIYIPLPNPMQLSAAGTVQNNSGQDVIPFYYPYSEIDNTTPQSYYVVVTNSSLQTIFTRENFPFNVTQPVTPEVSTLKNYVINNVFWRNLGTVAPNTNLTLLAPSNHDGFSSGTNASGGGGDIQYYVNTTGDTDSITFETFPAGTFLSATNVNDITPEYYANVTCTGDVGNATQKWIQFPLQLHVKNLELAEFTVTFWAQLGGSSANNMISPKIYQYLGAGVTSPTPITIGTGPIPLTPNWTQYTLSGTFPASPGSSALSSAGNDAFFFLLSFPTDTTFNISIAKPCLYLGNTVPTNEFQTYDQVAAIANSPRTGDVRTSLNSFSPYGWVLCNDGVISDAGATQPSMIPIARYNIDTWPLFNLLWSVIASGSLPNAFYNRNGSSGTVGANAYADWNAGKQITLTTQLGNALASAGLSAQDGGTTTWKLGQAGGQENTRQVVNHAHTLGNATSQFIGSGATATYLNVGANAGASYGATDYAGTGSSMSLVQGTAFYNVFLKL